MKKDKFLTVFAVFDNETQEKLGVLQKNILKNNSSNGKQTMNIPFHISLGSFPIEKKEELKRHISQVCENSKAFGILLKNIGFFGDRVVFVEPAVNDDLLRLHNEFDGNYADGFAWHAHATLFIDDNDENVKNAKKIACENFSPINAKIVGIQMGEFFPTKMIIEKEF